MGLVRLRLRAERRSRDRWIGAVLLLALAGGAALIAAQAARRTDTAFTRDLAAGIASDAVVNANASGHSEQQTQHLRAAAMTILDRVDRSPLVIAHGRFGGASIYRIQRRGTSISALNTGSAFGLVAYDTDIGRTIARLRMYAGRPADPGPRRRNHDQSENRSDSPDGTSGLASPTFANTTAKDLDPDTQAPRLDRGNRLDLLVTSASSNLPENLLQPSVRTRRPHLPHPGIRAPVPECRLLSE